MPARRGGGGARDGERHGRGHGVPDGPAQGRRSSSSRHGRFSAPASTSSRSCCRVSASLRPSSTAPISTNGARRCGRRPKSSFSKPRPIPASKSIDIAAIADIAHRAWRDARRRQCLRLAGAAEAVTARRRLHRLFGDETYRRTGPMSRRRDPREPRVHRQAHPHLLAPDRSGAIALQCLGHAEIARDACRCASPSRPRNAEKIADSLAGHPNIKRLVYPGRADHPQAELVRRQMKGGGTLIAFDSPWRQSRRLRLCQCAVDHQDFQQSRRRQEHHHPSGDDDASAADAGGARRNRASATGICGFRSVSKTSKT